MKLDFHDRLYALDKLRGKDKMKLSNKEIMELTIKMLDDAKGMIKEDEDVILDNDNNEEGLGMISYDLLWISVLPKALSKAAGNCPNQVKDDTMLQNLLQPFKKLKGINGSLNNYIKSKTLDDEIENLIDELDNVAYHIEEEPLK